MPDTPVRESTERAERRIVVFAGQKIRASTIEALERIVHQLPHARVLVVQAGDGRATWTQRVRAACGRLRGEPLSYPLELFGRALAALFSARRADAASRAVRLPTIEDLPNVWRVEFSSVHDPDCIEALRKFQPWLGIALGAPLLRREVFDVPERGTIHAHTSYLPEYRGGPPGFWELHDEANESGVSVHVVDDRLHTGEIILQHKMKIPPYTTPTGLRVLLETRATEVLTDAVTALDRDEARRTTQLVPRTPTRGRPSFLLRKRVERRCRRRRALHSGAAAGLRAFATRQFHRVYWYGWASLRNALRGARGQQRTAVLRYARVSDEFCDPFTIGIEQFARQLEQLKRHFDVLDMHQWLAARGKPRQRPALLISLDDGYCDEHLAARLCRRAGFPCTFFVCTGIVGTDSPFLHDLSRIGVRVPALTWDQCREMASWGFDIANHTVFHTDCGSTDATEALDEIDTAGRHLRNQLGRHARDAWFAFPFGGRENMSKEVLAGIERAGVEVVFSAYGGVNAQSFDLRDVRRIPVGGAHADVTVLAMADGLAAR